MMLALCAVQQRDAAQFLSSFSFRFDELCDRDQTSLVQLNDLSFHVETGFTEPAVTDKERLTEVLPVEQLSMPSPNLENRGRKVGVVID